MMYNYLVEFLGAVFVVYIMLATGNPIAIGSALALAIVIAGPISGGHINPVITIVMAAADKFPTNEIIFYALSQIMGGLVALELYKRYKL